MLTFPLLVVTLTYIWTTGDVYNTLKIFPKLFTNWHLRHYAIAGTLSYSLYNGILFPLIWSFLGHICYQLDQIFNLIVKPWIFLCQTAFLHFTFSCFALVLNYETMFVQKYFTNPQSILFYSLTTLIWSLSYLSKKNTIYSYIFSRLYLFPCILHMFL